MRKKTSLNSLTVVCVCGGGGGELGVLSCPHPLKVQWISGLGSRGRGKSNSKAACLFLFSNDYTTKQEV